MCSRSVGYSAWSLNSLRLTSLISPGAALAAKLVFVLLADGPCLASRRWTRRSLRRRSRACGRPLQSSGTGSLSGSGKELHNEPLHGRHIPSHGPTFCSVPDTSKRDCCPTTANAMSCGFSTLVRGAEVWSCRIVDVQAFSVELQNAEC